MPADTKKPKKTKIQRSVDSKKKKPKKISRTVNVEKTKSLGKNPISRPTKEPNIPVETKKKKLFSRPNSHLNFKKNLIKTHPLHIPLFVPLL